MTVSSPRLRLYDADDVLLHEYGVYSDTQSVEDDSTLTMSVQDDPSFAPCTVAKVRIYESEIGVPSRIYTPISALTTLSSPVDITSGRLLLIQVSTLTGTDTDEVVAAFGTIHNPTGVRDRYRLYSPASSSYVTGLLSVEIQDAFSRFARVAKISMDDPQFGTCYPRDTPLQLYHQTGTADPVLKFGGFVSELKPGQNTCTVELLSHDIRLRRRNVYKEYNSQLISVILEDLITTLTPLTWDVSLVTVTNDIEISPTWQGQTLDAVIDELATLSAGEEWGATDEGKYFFRPPSISRSPRDFTADQYYDTDFCEDGKAEVNKVTVFYGSGESTGAVSVSDLQSQLALQEAFGAPRPVVIETTKTYTEITTEAEARQQATQILRNHSVIQTGTISTWDGEDISPGDVARVVVPELDIDTDYRVAQIIYNWPSGETEVTLAENEDGVTDVLMELSDEVQRLDARDADTSATVTEYIQITETALMTVDSIRIYTRQVSDDQFVFGAPHGNLGAGSSLGDYRAPKVLHSDTGA